MKFNHLNVPDSWKHYWTRYPEGYTILEALISWVSQVDSMVDNQNNLNDNVEQFRNEIDDFVKLFDGRLQEEVTQILSDWQTSGFLDVVISTALQWELDNYITTNEQDKLLINQQLQQNTDEIEKIDTHTIFSNDLLDKMEIETVTLHPNFLWDWLPLKIRRGYSGSIILKNFNPVDYMYQGTGKTYYVSIKNGDDTNDGLTRETALKTIAEAKRKTDVSTIIVGSGFYDDMNGFANATSVNKNLNIIADEGADVTVTTHRALTWTKSGSHDYVYQATRTQFGSVWDSKYIDEYGDALKLEKVSSVNEVDNTPNSYYYASNIVYVHLLDHREPDDDLWCFLNINNLYNIGNYHVFTKGIKYYGGNQGVARMIANAGDTDTLLVAVNCEFKYGTNTPGVVASYGAKTLLIDCVFARGASDGANYHIYEGNIPKAIEINCVGRHNGLDANNNQNNGSTMHDGGTVVRINCTYHDNEGPNVHDINPGTQSYVLGCSSYDSAATSGSRRSNYRVEQGAEMFIDSSITFGSDRDLWIGEDSKMFIHNVLEEKWRELNGELIVF